MWWFVLTALAHDVVVFGDSWAEGGGDELGAVLAARGRPDLTVDNVGIGGTTAEWWNDTDPTALADAVSANTDAGWVWLSILGNDTFQHHLARDAGGAAPDNEAELRAMVSELVAVHPDVVVLMVGYDYLNFEQSLDCLLTAAVYFPQLVDWGGLTTGNVNAIFERDVGDVIARVAADHPQLVHVPVWGTLQAAGGIPGAPVQALPSPASLMSDCIHPNSTGYTRIHEALWDGAFALAPPVASMVVEPRVCADQPVQATSAASPADAWRWTVDGVEAGSDALSTMLDPGTHTVRLWVRHGAWTDTAETEVEVVARPQVQVVAEPESVCPGDTVVLTATEEVSWSMPGGVLGHGRQAELAPTSSTTVSATAGDLDGCQDVVHVELAVLPVPDLWLDGAATAEAGEAVTLTLSGAGGAEVIWSAPAGVVQGSGATVTVVFERGGTHEVTAGMLTEDGCEVAVAHTVEVSAAAVDPPEPRAPEDVVASCGCDGGGAGALTGGWLLALLAWRRRPTIPRRPGHRGAR